MFSSCGIIYGLINSDTLELRYVGQTIKSPDERLRRHKRSPCTAQLRNWLNIEPVSIVVLERVAKDGDLNEAERWWIRKWREQGAHLLNQTNGGSAGYKFTIETRAKISASLMGRAVTPEHKAKLSAAAMGNQRWLGRTHTPETKFKLSVAKKGRALTDEHRANISKGMIGIQNHLGHIHTPEARAKMGAAISAAAKRRRLTDAHRASISATLKLKKEAYNV